MRDICLRTLLYAVEHNIGDPYIVGCKAVEWHEKGYITDNNLSEIQGRLFPEEQGDNDE